MKPSISLHGVVKLELSAIRYLSRGQRLLMGTVGEGFACRDLIVTDDKGDKFEVTIFGKDVDNITLLVEMENRPPEPTDAGEAEAATAGAVTVDTDEF